MEARTLAQRDLDWSRVMIALEEHRLLDADMIPISLIRWEVTGLVADDEITGAG